MKGGGSTLNKFTKRWIAPKLPSKKPQAYSKYLEGISKARHKRDFKMAITAGLMVTIAVLFYVIFPDGLEIDIPNVHFNNVTLYLDPQNITQPYVFMSLNFTLTIFNPNIFRFTLEGVECQLWYREWYVGKISQADEEITFARNIWTLDVVEAEFYVSSDVINMTEQLGKDMLRGFFRMNFIGKAWVSVFGLPTMGIPFKNDQKMEPIPIVVTDISEA